ncbi:MAG: hypothetical protein ACPGAM_10510 [Candidatus Puniceispirillaceae bacterium]
MIFRQKVHVKREPCRRCMIIRLFLMMVVGVIVLGILGGSSLSHLSVITPSLFGWIFGGVAISYFVVRFILWRTGKSD